MANLPERVARSPALQDAIRRAMADDGLRYLFRVIIDRSGFFGDTHEPSGPMDPTRLAFNAGIAVLGREIVGAIQLVDEQAFALMMGDLLAEENDAAYQAMVEASKA